MPRTQRTHLAGDPVPQNILTPSPLAKQEFGRRLYRLMISRGWNQSELARRAGIKRDSVSTYIRGVSLPTDQNLAALANALNVKPNKLLPSQAERAIEADQTSIEMRVSSSDPTKAWLRVSQLVSIKTAAKVLDLLNDDDVTSDGE